MSHETNIFASNEYKFICCMLVVLMPHLFSPCCTRLVYVHVAKPHTLLIAAVIEKVQTYLLAQSIPNKIDSGIPSIQGHRVTRFHLDSCLGGIVHTWPHVEAQQICLITIKDRIVNVQFLLGQRADPHWHMWPRLEPATLGLFPEELNEGFLG
jgi:hypothetical protein